MPLWCLNWCTAQNKYLLRGFKLFSAAFNLICISLQRIFFFHFVFFSSQICLISAQILLTVFSDWLWADSERTFQVENTTEFWKQHVTSCTCRIAMSILKKRVYNTSFARPSWNSVHKHLFHLLDSVFFMVKRLQKCPWKQLSFLKSLLILQVIYV